MSGLVCLQGGAEFGPACVEMDTEVLERSPGGPVVVLADAAAPGRAQDMAVRNAITHYGELTTRPILGSPNSRDDLAGALAALEGAGIVVLPGGSPARLLDALSGPLGDRLLEAHRRGVSISGASAGAMVLCRHVAMPGAGLASGLGLVEGIAIPHFDGSDWWDLDVPDDVTRWGLPECGGILVDDTVRAIGAGTALRRREGEITPV